jgi:hypothetical protein
MSVTQWKAQRMRYYDGLVTREQSLMEKMRHFGIIWFGCLAAGTIIGGIERITGGLIWKLLLFATFILILLGIRINHLILPCIPLPFILICFLFKATDPSWLHLFLMILVLNILYFSSLETVKYQQYFLALLAGYFLLWMLGDVVGWVRVWLESEKSDVWKGLT